MILPTDADLAALAVDSYRLAPAGDVLDAGEDRAVITRRPDIAIVTVRGTANYRGWASDFLVLPKQARAHPLLGAGEMGMVDGAVALWAVLRPALDPKVPLVIVGHSRGAGEAPWIAGLAILDGFTVSYVLCLEAPWCAGLALGTFLAKVPVPGRQYINGNDPVPLVPEEPWLIAAVWPIVRIGSAMVWPMACHSITLIAAELLALRGKPDG